MFWRRDEKVSIAMAYSAVLTITYRYCRVGPPPHGDGCKDPSLRGSISDIHFENVQVHTNGE
jgi:hypothetical protein